jgi:hypothetical protein
MLSAGGPMSTRYTHLSPRLSVVLLALAACDNGTCEGEGCDEAYVFTEEERELLDQCQVKTTWTPGDSDFWGDGEFLGLKEATHCIVIPAEQLCPDAAYVTGIGDDCVTQTTVCVTGNAGRLDEVRDTGWHTDESHDVSVLDRCCYTYVGVKPSYVCGRPFLISGQPTVAPILPVPGWSSATPDTSTRSPAALHRWTEDAAAEHASIAAFAALTLDLLAHGFPADLVQATARAQAEEVAHARGALQIASRLAGRPLAPGPLTVGHTRPSLLQLAVDTAVDGGLGESLAAAIAAARLAVCTDPLTREHLSRVVQDEARHAALAWEIVEHAVLFGGEEVAEAVRAALTRAVEQSARTPMPAEPLAPEHGLCGDAALTRARDQVLREVFGWRVAA